MSRQSKSPRAWPYDTHDLWVSCWYVLRAGHRDTLCTKVVVPSSWRAETGLGKIGHELIMVGHYQDALQHMGENAEMWEDLANAERTVSTLKEFHTMITRFWDAKDQCMLGHILHSPPISPCTSDKSFTEDWVWWLWARVDQEWC